MDSCSAKITDFGVSAQITPQNDLIRGSEGTYHFMAPECLKCEGEEGFGGKKADIWSLGVSLYSLVFLKLPFFRTGIIELMEDIRKKP
jgi:[calcium/calmodulin-dependent protein kinase] kinase